MKEKLESLLRQKQNDRLFQIIVGIFALAMAIFTFGISLFFLGIVHAISTLYWAFKKEVPRTIGRRIIQPINIVVVILFIGGLLADYLTGYRSGNVSGSLVIGLLCIGPVLGISYFNITNDKIKHLKELPAQQHSD